MLAELRKWIGKRTNSGLTFSRCIGGCIDFGGTGVCFLLPVEVIVDNIEVLLLYIEVKILLLSNIPGFSPIDKTLIDTEPCCTTSAERFLLALNFNALL